MTQTVAQPAAATATPSNDAVVMAAINQISHIATLPEVTMKIIKLVEDHNSTAQDLNHVITNDPALGARILKVVNSAFYGLPGQVGSINRAIVLLGLNAVKNIAIAASLAKLFRGGQISPHFDAKELWKHSIAVGAGTRLLAAKAGLGLPDEAFLCGLMHDVGIMVEIQAKRAQFVEVVDRHHAAKGRTLREVETEILGANHEQFGAALCKAWKFPVSFAYVTGFHHRPMELAEDKRTLTGLVHIADIIAARMGLGFTASVETTEINFDLLAELNLTADQVEETSEGLLEAMEEAASLLKE